MLQKNLNYNIGGKSTRPKGEKDGEKTKEEMYSV